MSFTREHDIVSGDLGSKWAWKINEYFPESYPDVAAAGADAAAASAPTLQYQLRWQQQSQ